LKVSLASLSIILVFLDPMQRVAETVLYHSYI
jgi:hypothetical protein